MSVRLGLVGLALVATALATVAAGEDSAVSVPGPDDLTGSGSGAGSEPAGDPGGTPPIDPNQATKDLSERLNSVGERTGTFVPAPKGNKGIDEIGEEVGAVLKENWLETLLVSVVMAVTGFASWILASRYIDPTVALSNPQRSMLYGFIKGNPGVHLKQLSGEFRMKTSTVLWHVRKLEAADLVRSKKANGYRVFYPVSGGLEARKVSEAVTVLSNPNARSIFSVLAHNSGLPFRMLLEQLPINSGTVRWHLKKLRQAGLLEEVEAPGAATLRVTELGLKAWTQVQGMPATTVEVPVLPGAAPTEPVASEVVAESN